jgi:hypothetical chaperone protein
MQYFGLDFGTTNSSLAWARPDGSVQLCDLDAGAPNLRVLRSLLYYSLEARGFIVGQGAIDEYLAEDMQGTLIQSVKTFLADDSFEETFVHDRTYKLEDLISFFFRHVRQVVRTLTDDDVTLVVGRPAVFLDDPERETRARERMTRAAHLGQFFTVDFQYEPIAAGLAYETTLARPELALIGDFGGGTSDFTVMRLGNAPAGATDRSADILASSGVQIGGDTFDARIMDGKLTPYFGRGTTFRSMEGQDMPFPLHLLARLGRWHQVGFLRNAATREQLRRIRHTASDPDAVDALQELIQSNLAFFLFREIERAKTALSTEPETTIRFAADAIDIEQTLRRDEFESLIAADLETVRATMQLALDDAGVGAGDIEAVFLTGGSAQIPAVQQIFVDAFGRGKIRNRDFLTSVALGLGVDARTRSARAQSAITG